MQYFAHKRELHQNFLTCRLTDYMSTTDADRFAKPAIIC